MKHSISDLLFGFFVSAGILLAALSFLLWLAGLIKWVLE